MNRIKRVVKAEQKEDEFSLKVVFFLFVCCLLISFILSSVEKNSYDYTEQTVASEAAVTP